MSKWSKICRYVNGASIILFSTLNLTCAIFWVYFLCTNDHTTDLDIWTTGLFMVSMFLWICVSAWQTGTVERLKGNIKDNTCFWR
jgi:hypothetical protein